MLARARRLSDSSEWRRVRRQGRCAAGRYARICVLPSEVGERFGFTTERKLGSAVERNLARRRVREAFAQVYTSDDRPRLVTVTATRDAVGADFTELKQSLADQLRRLGVGVRAARRDVNA